MYCSSSQLLLIRLVGPPDVVAVVAVVAVAVAVAEPPADSEFLHLLRISEFFRFI